jgi:hypothetical protein
MCFYDQTHVSDLLSNNRLVKANFRSTGTEIYFDTKWCERVAGEFWHPYSRLLDKDLFGLPGSNRWEIVLPVSLL